ncbi:hypothetical protein OKA05_18310 [Luteolibacter arcticus]|uniref:Lipoprotein n=1 Tax=Luteolibacter arcticus TaxID=1581411 RepID=A0ABT3GLX8_9BACT|nr:hypothetical protein [Luteolibacter arcticus]MCW1924525.1 hypothetical protein [Luteolibacter arcticus]
MKPLALPFFLGLLVSCRPVTLADQPGLSRPVFDFASTGPRSMECGLSSQLETGRTSATVSAGGCASCR